MGQVRTMQRCVRDWRAKRAWPPRIRREVIERLCFRVLPYSAEAVRLTEARSRSLGDSPRVLR